MLSRAIAAAAALLLSTGCLGFGAQTVVPGPRQHIFPHGLLLAARFGFGGIAIGDRTLDAAVADIRAEYHHAPTAALGISGAVGYQAEWVSHGGADVSREGLTFAVTGTVVPIRPFILRLGAFLQPSTTEVEGMETDSISRGVLVGPGMVVRFSDWYGVLSFDAQLSAAGAVRTPDGPRSYRSSQLLLNLVVVRWNGGDAPVR